ncbi:carbonate dehydratase [Algicola sagamiensis]|uniref:carbonate dehydratase n=1 Tax=Algicola sagamiensis TaxID=163869 RepID=UPI000365BF22|nr:carbonate dehydratase [Algicola sagamiensis]
MSALEQLFENNRAWAERIKQEDPEFFTKLAAQQTPEYLWIGCSDSRVPANQIVGLLPGEIFVHRNIANQVIHTDLNCLSVLQYAVEVLKVKHIIVSGHYGCGGVHAAVDGKEHGLIDNWLRHIADTAEKHEKELDAITDEKQRLNRLCELNVVAQVKNLSNTPMIKKAWAAGQDLTIHGWIYGIEDGVIRDLHVCTANYCRVPS